MKHKLLVLTTLLVLASLLAACSFPTIEQYETTSALASTEKIVNVSVSDNVQAEDDIERPEGWDEVTHGKDSDPDYETVFPQDEVNRIDITITAENWQVMQDDMTEKYGEFGTKTNERMGPGGQRPQQQEGMQPPAQQEGVQPPQMGDGEAAVRPNRPIGNDGPAMMEADDSNPVWVPVTISFEGDTWTSVGLRFKGNSSLKNSWSQGTYKIPLEAGF